MSLRKTIILLATLCAALPQLALVTATAARADELPMPKAGLWEMKMSMQMPGMPSGAKAVEMNTKRCTDQASEKEARNTLLGVNDEFMSCPKQDVKKTATGYIVDSVCTSKLAGMTTTTHSEITGDFSSGFTMKSVSHTKDSKGTQDSSTMTGSAKWLGACPAGWKPGDVEVNGGKKFNINDR